MPTLYSIKPAFQDLLRPLAARLVMMGVTANGVTLAAAALSIAAGLLLATCHQNPWIFWIVPLVLFLRMALNAIDGMMARDFGQASTLGMYLNELADIVSDAALILPFALVPLFPAWSVIIFAILAALTEYAGVLGVMAGGVRRYNGPLGKSDRALVLGVMAVLIATGTNWPLLFLWVFTVMSILSVLTIINRVRAGLREAHP